MLRELQVTMGKPADAAFKSAAADDVITGMGAVKDEATKTFTLPTEETVADIYLIDKERIPVGINAARLDISDYDEEFVTVEKDEYAKLIAYYPGERIATDQYSGELADFTVDDRLAVGTDGKWVKATSVASKYVYKGEFDDAGHALMLIEISDTPAANA